MLPPGSFQQPLSFFVRRSAYTLTSAGSDPAVGADAGIRTPNLMITRHLLCRLSYIGLSAGVGSLSDLNPPGGLSQTANVLAALCWMPPEGGAVGEEWARRITNRRAYSAVILYGVRFALQKIHPDSVLSAFRYFPRRFRPCSTRAQCKVQLTSSNNPLSLFAGHQT